MEVYFDNAATTRVCPEAAEIAYRVMTEDYGNPSSTHKKGREAKKILDTARKNLALALGCEADELFFTSCGSESDNWALLSGVKASHIAGAHIISSQVEHDAVRKSLDLLERQGCSVTRLSPDASGKIRPEDVEGALRENTVLVSLMLVNNETGAVTDIAEISKMLKRNGSRALLHTDAVQGFLKVPFRARTLGADMISVSGHKIHAPKGIGALYVRRGLNLSPLIVGGSQENSRRAGTEALPNIAAFGEAARVGHALAAESQANMASLREYMAERLTRENPGLVVIGGGSPHLLSVSLPGYRSEVIMNFLEAREIYVSKSSACKRGGRSHVLEAMGLPAEVIDGAIRIGLSRFSTMEEAEALCDAVRSARENLRSR